MKADDAWQAGRRAFLHSLGIAALSSTLSNSLATYAADASNGQRLKIGVIGAGKIGGALGALWVKSGHQVLFSARDLEAVKKSVANLGPNARAGTPKEAAVFGEVVLVSVPYAALPQIGHDLADQLKGKVVLDTCNPIPGRDGDMAIAAQSKGAGIASAEYLPGTRLVRAFNTVPYTALQTQANRTGDRIAVPLAGDDKAALAVAAQLVEDAGFQPLIVGILARAKEFDVGTPAFGKALTTAELRRALGMSS
jgi:predicted dinucleotide-binding enzyme